MPAKKSATKTKRGSQPIDVSAEFERLLQHADEGKKFVLRLYVTGNTVRSGQAIANVRSLCDEYLVGRYDLEVVDIYQQPKAAERDQIIAAPTLIKEFPNPPKRLIGDLADRDKVIVGLNLVDQKPGKKALKTKWLKL
jgi:circadian clock protein KaiB